MSPFSNPSGRPRRIARSVTAHQRHAGASGSGGPAVVDNLVKDDALEIDEKLPAVGDEFAGDRNVVVLVLLMAADKQVIVSGDGLIDIGEIG